MRVSGELDFDTRQVYNMEIEAYDGGEPTLSGKEAFWIKSVSWEYSCDEEYLEEFNKGKILKYPSLLAALTRNRLDPIFLQIFKVLMFLTLCNI